MGHEKRRMEKVRSSVCIRSPVFRLSEAVLTLPKELEQQFGEFVATYEETSNMQYVTNIERQGIQKGLQQGLQQGLLQKSREDLLEVLKARIQHVPNTLVAQIEALTEVSQLSSLLREAVLIDSLASFAQRLRKPLTTPTLTRVAKKPR